MALYKRFESKTLADGLPKVELVYSFWHFLSFNHPWFCRVWVERKCKYTEGTYGEIYGEAYAKNKFTAYRMAMSGHKIPVSGREIIYE